MRICGTTSVCPEATVGAGIYAIQQQATAGLLNQDVHHICGTTGVCPELTVEAGTAAGRREQNAHMWHRKHGPRNKMLLLGTHCTVGAGTAAGRLHQNVPQHVMPTDLKPSPHNLIAETNTTRSA